MHRSEFTRLDAGVRTTLLALTLLLTAGHARSASAFDPRSTPSLAGDPVSTAFAPIAFASSGGSGGDFDWQIGDDTSATAVTFVLDTTFTVITNVTQTATENVVNGLVQVRDFTIKPNGKLIVQGPNACRILATGTVVINGQLLVRGTSNPGVTSFDTTNIRDPGAPGQAGGGSGGTGNWLITQSTPMGQPGYGAFNAPGGGGGGGETSYSVLGEDARRAAGGGGGAFGADVTYMATSPGPIHACPDQSSIGLDAEPGFGGGPNGNGALHPPGTPAAGGAVGVRPFFDGNPNNDFWGTMITPAGRTILGELSQPWAGAGGGAGGNACDTSSFPTTPFSNTGDEKGAGGGGGGGSITILAQGDIVIGQSTANLGFGVIDASGGTGGGGESTNSNNHVGGGSGGGSGGHVILQSAANIDFTRCTSTTNPPGGIYALGGQGGEGFLAHIDDGAGGALGGFQTPPAFDALPRNAYPSTSLATPCAMRAGVPAGAPPGTVVYTTTNTVGDFDPSHPVVGGGGDGGPGIIQLHVPSLGNILPPAAAGQTFYKIIKPPPVGTSLRNINLPPTGNWGLLLPNLSISSMSSDAEILPPKPSLEMFRVPSRL
jgi:hypothetical protein